MALPGHPALSTGERKTDPEPIDLGSRTMTEESVHAQLMVPDILMPVQYYDGMRRDNPETQAVKRLMFAVLADAVRCFQTYADAQSRAGRLIFGETEWWILDRNSDGPFTFEAICEALGIEPDCLRNGLHQWRVQQFGGMNPRRLGRRANVRSEGQISSPQRAQPRRRKGDIGRSNAVGNPSLVAHASRRDHLEDDTAPIEIYRDDPAMPSITPDSASPLTREHEQEECGVQ
jgi:hypothetical protein